MIYDLYKKNNLKLDLLNFNIFGSSEYEKNGHFFKTVKFCFAVMFNQCLMRGTLLRDTFFIIGPD